MHVIPVANVDLDFDDATQTYRYNGDEIPSVTKTLDDNRLRMDWSRVPVDVLLAARERGVAVHCATSDADAGRLDSATLSPAIAAYVEAWRAFKHDRGVQIIELERRYAHPLLRYGGTLDRVARVDGMRHPVVIDIKTGDQTGVEYQTAAYAEVFQYVTRTPLVYRWSVRLDPDRLIPYSVTPYDDPHDVRVFLAALQLTTARLQLRQSWQRQRATPTNRLTI